MWPTSMPKAGMPKTGMPEAGTSEAGTSETEGTDPRLTAIDQWPPGAILSALWEGQLAAVAAVGPALPALERAAAAALPRLQAGGRLAYAGAGTSGRIAAQDGAELAPTFGWDRLVLLIAGGPTALMHAAEGAEDRTDTAAADAASLGPGDVLIAVAASGRTPYTIACVKTARGRGALTIAIANGADTPLLRAADHAVLIQTGAEPIAGSTRMKAGTAQKVALNLLSTLMMVGLGRVFRGRMVDMAVTNAKLRDRAVAMVRELAGVDATVAGAALQAADGHVKLAILLAQGQDRAAAQAALAEAQGHLGRIL